MNGRSSIAVMLTGAGLLCGLVGYAVGVGSTIGRIEQVLVDHERRLNAQDTHMEVIDAVAIKTESRLSTIEAQLNFLVRQAQAGVRALGPR